MFFSAPSSHLQSSPQFVQNIFGDNNFNIIGLRQKRKKLTQRAQEGMGNLTEILDSNEHHPFGGCLSLYTSRKETLQQTSSL